MKIALLGYGKMGQVIERIATERGHEIVLKKDDKINVSKNNAKAVSKKSAKNDSSMVLMKSVKNKKAKKMSTK